MLRRRKIRREVALLAAATAVVAAILAAYGLVTWSASSGSAASSSRQVRQGPSADDSPLGLLPSEPGLRSEGEGMQATETLQTPGEGDGTKTRSSAETDSDVDNSLKHEGPVVLDFSRFRPVLPKDAIRPIYEPKFAPGKLTSLDPGELVMGVEINGESKAYPVGPLNYREMVNDVVGGVPVLVTW